MLRWFAQCYDLEFLPHGGAVWRRMVLPSSGGLGDQDARLINGMEYIASVHQQLLLDSERRRRREASKAKRRNETRHEQL